MVDDSTKHILGDKYLTQLGGRVEFLHPFIYGRWSGLMRFHDGSDSECVTNFMQTSEKMLQRHGQWLDKRSRKELWAIHGCFNGMLGSG
jgi:hypothetical protein